MFAPDIGIDLGTANVLVYVRGKGVVDREPSVVAINRETGRILAVGNEARNMIGRTPGNITAIRPLKNGVIADYDVTEIMLKHFVHRVCGHRRIFKPRVVVCVPTGVTEVETRAVMEAALEAGARDVYLISEPMAAAIGAGLNVAEPSGNMVVDIGGGTTDIAVISLGGEVVSESPRIGGDKLDEAIVRYVKRQYNLAIGERTAEDIKINIGCACRDSEYRTMEIRGRDLLTGLPRPVTLNSNEVYEALLEPLTGIVDAIRSVLERTPPELASDIIDKGIVLTGGGALLRDFDRLLSEETGMPAYVAEDALSCVAVGTGKVLESLDELKGTVIIGSRSA